MSFSSPNLSCGRCGRAKHPVLRKNVDNDVEVEVESAEMQARIDVSRTSCTFLARYASETSI